MNGTTKKNFLIIYNIVKRKFQSCLGEIIMDKDGFMEYVKEEFPGVIDTHWSWDLLKNILDFAILEYDGKPTEELIKFLMCIIPEVTGEEYRMFM